MKYSGDMNQGSEMLFKTLLFYSKHFLIFFMINFLGQPLSNKYHERYRNSGQILTENILKNIFCFFRAWLLFKLCRERKYQKHTGSIVLPELQTTWAADIGKRVISIVYTSYLHYFRKIPRLIQAKAKKKIVEMIK